MVNGHTEGTIRVGYIYLTNTAKAPGWYCEAGFLVMFLAKKPTPP